MSNLIPLAVAGAGVWWVSRRLAPVAAPPPPVPGRGVVVQRERAGVADDPSRLSEDVRAWAIEAGANGGGSYVLGIPPPEPRWLAAGTSTARSRGVLASVPYLGAPDALAQAVARPAAQRRLGPLGQGFGSWKIGGDWYGRNDRLYGIGLPGSPLAVRLGIDAPIGSPPPTDRLLMPQLPGQVAGGIPSLGVGQAQVRGLVALGALWSSARMTRAWWPFRDAMDHAAGEGVGVVYLVSTLGRAAVVIGRRDRSGAAGSRSPIGQLAADAWTPCVQDASGRWSRSLVLPRSDWGTYDGQGPARSPWIGQALLQFLALPVVELPGLRTIRPGGPGWVGMPRMYDGARWDSPAWARARSRLVPGANWARFKDNRWAYPETHP